MTTKTINTWDREGVFVLMSESKSQAPMIMETEGEFSSFDAAHDRVKRMKWLTRACVCRVIPVSGNELLALDMIRMQPKPEDKEMPF